MNADVFPVVASLSTRLQKVDHLTYLCCAVTSKNHLRSLTFSDSWKMDSISKAVAAYNKYTCIRYVRLHESEEELKKREIVLDRVRFIINSSM